MFLCAHQLFIEGFQCNYDGFRNYIGQSSNRIDIFTLFGNILVLLLMEADQDIYKVRIFASIAVVSLWIQMFFWFRLFDGLAQYVDLIFSTVYDIRNFMYVLFALMLMFGSGL